MQAKERRIIKRIGVDEKAVATRHRYPTFRDRENAFSVNYFLVSTKARTPA
jgi:hypothetical protein